MMGVAAAVLAAGASYFLVTQAPRPRLWQHIGTYLAPPPNEVAEPVASIDPAPPRPADHAGFGWSSSEYRLRRLGSIVTGVFVGLLIGRGDLFASQTTGRTTALALLGGGAGALLFSMRLSTRAERRSHQLRLELPVLADAIALRVIAGDSIPMALDDVVSSSTGIGSAELARAMDAYHSGAGLTEALADATRRTVAPPAGRLYTLLGQVHLTGGRLADALADLAIDYRAALTRDLTAEQGRRAVATYGPILALMVPVTLLFLMYPTLVGLRDLAAGQ